MDAHETQPREKSLPPLQRKVMAELFSTLQLIYGSRFVKQEDTVIDMMNLWSYQLRAVSDGRIQVAAMEVVDHYPTHPPTIGEFRKVIKTVKDPNRYESRPLCPKCRSYEITQRHKDICG